MHGLTNFTSYVFFQTKNKLRTSEEEKLKNLRAASLNPKNLQALSKKVQSTFISRICVDCFSASNLFMYHNSDNKKQHWFQQDTTGALPANRKTLYYASNPRTIDKNFPIVCMAGTLKNQSILKNKQKKRVFSIKAHYSTEIYTKFTFNLSHNPPPAYAHNKKVFLPLPPLLLLVFRNNPANVYDVTVINDKI